MTKNAKKMNLPKWLHSKYFLFGVALIVATGVVLGINSFAAAGPPEYGCKTTPTIGVGNAGACVKKAQYALNRLCKQTAKLTVDGIFGTKVKNRVMGFQKAYNRTLSAKNQIAVDGIIGPQTWVIWIASVIEPKAGTFDCYYP
jgi:hypothetical protein